MRDKFKGTFNGNINTGSQHIENQTVTVINSTTENSYCVYDNAKVAPAKMQDISKITFKQKLYQILSIISSIVTILTFIFTYLFNANLITSIFFILLLLGITFCFIGLLLEYNNFFKNLERKGYHYLNASHKLYLKPDDGTIYEVTPPMCPYCKIRKSNMTCHAGIEYPIGLNINDYINKMLLILQGKQRTHVFFTCTSNPDHIIEIDCTQFNIPPKEQ